MTSLVEYTHITEMQDDLNRKLSESHRKDLGRMESLRTSILGFVVAEAYKRASEEMVAYVALKTSYPEFQFRAQRYVQHSSELIHAIDTKRNFPGLASLSLAKQQEIHEKVLEHFEELKQTLRTIEKIERDAKLTDVRSTVWVVRALCHGVALIVVAAFLIDISQGMFTSVLVVTDSYVDTLGSWLVNVIKF